MLLKVVAVSTDYMLKSAYLTYLAFKKQRADSSYSSAL